MATETLSRPSVSSDTEQINAENLYKPEDTTSIDSERESLTTFTTLDWTATLSPARRSCINLTNVEPCVNKAMVNLQALKEALLLKACLQPPAYETPPETVTVSVVDSKEQPKSVSVQVSTTADSDPTGLSVEGVRTGILVEKYGIIEKVRIQLL